MRIDGRKVPPDAGVRGGELQGGVKAIMLKKKTMIQIRRVLLLLALVMILLYGLNRLLLYRSFDKTGPEIQFDEELLKVSVKVTEEELLEGVKATDNKDGDVTDTVIIESISKLLPGNERIVTYAAFDNDNHVGKAERRIQYKDYKAPRFSLDEPLTTSLSSDMSEMIGALHAKDCIDGDISDQIVITNADITGLSGDEASMTYEVQVTNSCGDIASLQLPVSINMSGTNSQFAEIKLEKYLIYKKVGKSVDFESYIEDVVAAGNVASAADVKVTSDYDKSEPGVYTATYTLEVNGETASTQLYIVVEE